MYQPLTAVGNVVDAVKLKHFQLTEILLHRREKAALNAVKHRILAKIGGELLAQCNALLINFRDLLRLLCDVLDLVTYLFLIFVASFLHQYAFV